MGARGIINSELTSCETGALLRFDALIQQIDHLLDHYLADCDLGASTVEALRIIDQAGARGIRQCVLAEALHLPAATVSRMVDSLVKNGLVTRADYPTDRRVTILSLTAEGNHRLERRREGYRAFAKALAPHTMSKISSVEPLLEEIFHALATVTQRRVA